MLVVPKGDGQNRSTARRTEHNDDERVMQISSGYG